MIVEYDSDKAGDRMVTTCLQSAGRPLTGHLNVIDCELSAYRKGFLKVCIDFDRGLLVWKNSHDWCKNFIKALTEEDMSTFRRIIDLENWSDASNPIEWAGQTSWQKSWRVTFSIDHQPWSCRSDDFSESRWLALSRLIEAISHMRVRV